ncbi:synaptosomal-associated protein 29 [Galendromus occidentalis]|uniref:Synaptosomal-associated protein 29 n=1 Tax=Galendromus occidentalis TaxID=34638 RepID=A0AAJ6VW14_9ACAR|nr:synaptosomal-associated protein 29 [Galendromus occidentalis]
MSIKSPTVNKNPFYDPDDDDVDDDTFVNYRARAYDNAEHRMYEEKRQQLLEERREVEDRMLQSSSSAVRALYETEQIGIETADELVRQGEQLKKVDRNLDDIHNVTKTTQKHLTAMKSVFSGFKNYFGRSNNTENSTSQMKSSTPEEQPSSALAAAAKKVRGDAESARQKNHPALRSRFDTSGFGAADDDDDAAVGNDKAYKNRPMTRSEMVEHKLNKDLTELSSGMSRLKTLAQGLSSELDEQCDLISTIDNKVDTADVIISSQTKQMNRLLKK